MDNLSIAPERSIADWYIAVAQHLEAQPHLKPTILGAQQLSRYVHVSDRSADSVWRPMLTWADSLNQVGQVVVKADDDSPHIMLLGAAQDTAMNVLVILSDPADVAVLASRIDLKRGTRFDLDVIRDIVERGALARVRVIRQGDIYDGVNAAAVEAAHELALAGTRVTS